MRAALAILLVPAFAAARPTFSTSISADAPFADGVNALRTKLDACWRAPTTVKLSVTVAAGSVKDIELVEVDPKAPLPCLTKVLRRIALAAETNGVFEVTLRSSELDNLLHKFGTKLPVVSFSGIGVEAQTGVGASRGVGVGAVSSRGDVVHGGVASSGRTPPSDVKIGFAPADGSTVEIDRVVRARAGVLRACYQRELAKDPKLAGKITIAFAIGADGKVTKARVAVTTMKNTHVEDCIRNQVMRLVFPATVGPASINYPFLFTQG